MRIALLAGLAMSLAGCGGAEPPPRTGPSLEFLAGNTTGPGNADGLGDAARFRFPMGVATDIAGNVYVADTDNDTIRKITRGGLVTTLAGSAGVPGSADGAGEAARFDHPQGVAADRFGNVYVADTNNSTIRRITPTGQVTTLAGTAGVTASADGNGAAAGFWLPQGVATDISGNVYVADTYNNTVRKITPGGDVTTLAGTARVGGFADGTGAAARFDAPGGVTTDRLGNVYVAEPQSGTIRKVTPAGQVTTLAGTWGLSGHIDGTGAAARFYSPAGVAVDRSGNVYVADFDSLRKITPAGQVTTLAGAAQVLGDANGTGSTASFWGLQAVAIDRFGDLYGADTDNNSIRKITLAGQVTKLAGGTPDIVGNVDGAGTAASFYYPQGVATDGYGNAYVADTNDNTIRRVTPAGQVSTFAGFAGVFGSADGPAAQASFNSPQGVATDSSGNVYVADTGNDTIRKIAPPGQVTTLAGTARVTGSADGIGAAASFNSPMALATDRSGNVYVADTGNYTIRRITPAGQVTTFAGAPLFAGSSDGTGQGATFAGPQGLTIDTLGNLYVADGGSTANGLANSTIRKITPARRVTTLAGTPGVTGHADGAGAAASFDFTPYFTAFSMTVGLATDNSGNVYVADTGNETIRKITPAGVVSTLAGHAGVAGFAPGSLPGVLNSPDGLALYGATMYITMRNAVVRVTNLP
jgi:hypothetical protein